MLFFHQLAMNYNFHKMIFRAIEIFHTLLISLIILTPKISSASEYQISLDTSSLAGQSAYFAFDFIGPGKPPNFAKILNFNVFYTNGNVDMLGDPNDKFPKLLSAVTGTDFFNEVEIKIPVIGAGIYFDLFLSENFTSGGRCCINRV